MSTPWKYEKERILHQRLIYLIGIFIFIIFLLICRMFYLQIICGDKYKEMSDKNRISVRLTLPGRGYIYDRNGVKLAENRKTFQAVLFREESKTYRQSIENFQKLIPLEEDELIRIDKEIKHKRQYMPIRVKNNLSFEEAALIQLNAPDLKGIRIEEELTRFYPLKENAAHLIGYVSFLTEKDVSDDKDSPLLDLPGYRIGRIGVEKGWEKTLQGMPGMRETEVNAFGRSIRVLKEENAQKGENLTLTIDSRLQEFALKAMGEEAGSAIVMDVHSGAILALVSAPSFDSNIFTRPIPQKIWNPLIQDEKKPLQNKAINGLYSPGSIFKLVVALAGLESGHITASRKVFCSGRTQIGKQYFHCWKRGGHGALTIEEALMHSCDVYFYELAQEIGWKKIISVAKRLGYGVESSLNLTGEKAGILPSQEWKKAKFKDNWRRGDTLNLSIGQGFLSATPLQMVLATARIANGGYAVEPGLVLGQIRQKTSESLGFSPYHLKLIRSGMSMVVNKNGGTAYKARFDINGQKMAGKTASTQVRRITMKEREKGVRSQEDLPWKYRDHAMFTAFAPLDNPQFAVIVAVEHGGGGSKTAAPIASQILQETLRLYPNGLTERKSDDMNNTKTN